MTMANRLIVSTTLIVLCVTFSAFAAQAQEYLPDLVSSGPTDEGRVSGTSCLASAPPSSAPSQGHMTAEFTYQTHCWCEYDGDFKPEQEPYRSLSLIQKSTWGKGFINDFSPNGGCFVGTAESANESDIIHIELANDMSRIARLTIEQTNRNAFFHDSIKGESRFSATWEDIPLVSRSGDVVRQYDYRMEAFQNGVDKKPIPMDKYLIEWKEEIRYPDGRRIFVSRIDKNKASVGAPFQNMVYRQASRESAFLNFQIVIRKAAPTTPKPAKSGTRRKKKSGRQ